jgi:hypothetical protein
VETPHAMHPHPVLLCITVLLHYADRDLRGREAGNSSSVSFSSSSFGTLYDLSHSAQHTLAVASRSE